MNDRADHYPANRPPDGDGASASSREADKAAGIELTADFAPFNQRNDMFNRAFWEPSAPAGAPIEPADIAEQLPPALERALFRTYEKAPARWDDGFTAFAPATIELLGEVGCRLVGIDTPSLDPRDSKPMPSHMAVSRLDIRVLEGIVLDDVAPGDYELIALPLKFADLDASSVRAVLRSL